MAEQSRYVAVVQSNSKIDETYVFDGSVSRRPSTPTSRLTGSAAGYAQTTSQKLPSRPHMAHIFGARPSM
jgi:hypothetical protein